VPTASVPRLYPELARIPPVPRPYRTSALGVPEPQVRLAFALATRGSYQALSITRSGVEIASQAEYAGSIPVIGSMTTWAFARLS
jgi:hypothetical protein